MNFLKYKWEIEEEFCIADEETVNGRKKFIIVILIDELNTDELPADLKNFMNTRNFLNFINATKSAKRVVKRLR